MEREAIFSPCRQCQYKHYCKKARWYIADKNGRPIRFIYDGQNYKSDENVRLRSSERKLKNPCFKCEKAGAYDDYLNLIYAGYPPSWTATVWSLEGKIEIFNLLLNE